MKLLQNLQTAQKKGLPYFISMDAALTKQQVKDMDLSEDTGFMGPGNEGQPENY